jgi:autotransporter-associated beta strand protein
MVTFSQPISSDLIANCTGNCSTGLMLNQGTFVLSAPNTYLGLTTVNSGASLVVTGSIPANSAGVTVNDGGILSGTGVVPATTINAGGTLAPGVFAPGLPTAIGNLSVNGSLALASTAIYLIQVSPTSASMTNVSGSASVGGTVNLVASPGSYSLGSKYTLLTTTGGPVTGTFSGVSLVGGSFGANIRSTLSYDANDVYLTLSQALLPTGPNFSTNQQNVANALNAFSNSGGILPAGFQNLFNLSPAQLAQALTQLEGQNNAGGGQQASFQLMNNFLLLMLNPSDSDRAGFGGAGFGAGSGAAPFAPEADDEMPAEVAAYAAKTSYYKAPIAPAPAPRRWNVWAAAFGGSNNTNGDPNGAGSASFSARTGAVAAGVDYKLTPDALVGVSLAGGGTSWGLAQGLGSGHTDAFQAGLYGSQRFGAWYLSGAAAFADYWASTSRQISLPAMDTLNANFNAQSWGGRVEGGYRFAWGAISLAPYAAFQAQSFSTPSYSEASTSGSNQFALSYASRTGTVERGELGSWLNTLYLLQGNSVLSLFGRAAWAHDWQNTPQASATFLGVSPIAGFIVNGAKPVADLGVVTAGTELRMAGGWAVMGKFDGEFGSGTQTYAGTARVRYVW